MLDNFYKNLIEKQKFLKNLNINKYTPCNSSKFFLLSDYELKIFENSNNNLISINPNNLKLKINFENYQIEKYSNKNFEEENLKTIDFENIIISNLLKSKNLENHKILNQNKDQLNYISSENLNTENISFSSIKNKHLLLKMTKNEIQSKIINIISNSKEYAIFFMINSEVNDEIKEKIKYYENILKNKFDKEILLNIYKLFLDLSEKSDPKFKEYLLKLDDSGYNIIHYFSALSKIFSHYKRYLRNFFFDGK